MNDCEHCGSALKHTGSFFEEFDCGTLKRKEDGLCILSSHCKGRHIGKQEVLQELNIMCEQHRKNQAFLSFKVKLFVKESLKRLVK